MQVLEHKMENLSLNEDCEDIEFKEFMQQSAKEVNGMDLQTHKNFAEWAVENNYLKNFASYIVDKDEETAIDAILCAGSCIISDSDKVLKNVEANEVVEHLIKRCKDAESKGELLKELYWALGNAVVTERFEKKLNEKQFLRKLMRDELKQPEYIANEARWVLVVWICEMSNYDLFETAVFYPELAKSLIKESEYWSEDMHNLANQTYNRFEEALDHIAKGSQI